MERGTENTWLPDERMLGMPVIAAALGRGFARLTPENVPYWLIHVLSCSQLGS